MSYQLRSDELDAKSVQEITNNPTLQLYLMSLQEDLRGIIAYSKELEDRIAVLEGA